MWDRMAYNTNHVGQSGKLSTSSFPRSLLKNAPDVALLSSFISIMLIGEYIHTLDDKKRLSLPVKFRQQLGKKLVITRGLEGCLFIYSSKEWQNISQRLGELGMGQASMRGFTRFMLSGAVEVDVDGAGRMLIPDFLKDFADLKNKVVVTGVQTRAEIWNEKAWDAYKHRIEKEADMLAEHLGGIGAL